MARIRVAKARYMARTRATRPGITLGLELLGQVYGQDCSY